LKKIEGKERKRRKKKEKRRRGRGRNYVKFIYCKNFYKPVIEQKQLIYKICGTYLVANFFYLEKFFENYENKNQFDTLKNV